MATCDLCGKCCGKEGLETLLPTLQSEEVRDICSECSRWANEQKSRLLIAASDTLQNMIAIRKGSSVKASIFWRIKSFFAT